MSQLGIMGMEACKASYEGGGEWLDALMEYLPATSPSCAISPRSFRSSLVEPEGTYLVWVDFAPSE